MEIETAGKKIRGRDYLAASVVTCLVMLFWSAYDSPMFPLYTSGDSSIFMLIGKGITEGKIPYIDLFDHKGPVLFWIEALGWAIGGRTGIWIIETLFTLISVILIMNICRKLGADFLLPTAGTAVVYLTYFGRGNLCENYSLPFIYLALLLVIEYYKSGKTVHPPIYAFIYGSCFALIAFIRINNATVICAFILVIMIRLIVSKEYGNLAANLLSGLLGILAVTFPICLYFYMHNALKDMLFCTFTYNFMYSAEKVSMSDSGLIGQIVNFMPITFTTVCFGYGCLTKGARKHDKDYYVSFFVVSLLYFIELLYTNTYAHYHTPSLPLYTVCLATAFPSIQVKDMKSVFQDRKRRIEVAGAGLITCIYVLTSIYNLCAPIYRHYLTNACSSRFEDVQRCIQVIPEAERNSVVGYGVAVSWYIDSEITPCYKYYAMQQWWSQENYDVNQAFLDYVSEEYPLWIISVKNLKEERLLKILQDRYVLVTEGAWAYYRYAG